MAEESENTEGTPLLWQMVGVLTFVFIIISLIGGSSGFDLDEPAPLTSQNQEVVYTNTGINSSASSTDQESIRDRLKNGLFSPFSGGNIFEKGSKIFNKENLDVRIKPAGSIIGQQLKRAVGTLIEGPVKAFNTDWWRVDYVDAPDGWVDAKYLTTKIGLYRLFNIFPIIFDFIKPILIIFVIILGLVIVWIRIRFNKVLQLKEKKRSLERREAGFDEEPIHTPVHPVIANASDQVEENHDHDTPDDEGVYSGPPSNLPTGQEVPVFVQTHASIKNERWEKVQRLILSANANDHRQAIIEADIILDKMLEGMGYEGESIGERLKKIEQSDFLTINKAWEAHRIRNKIAHAGSDFEMSKSEAERVIGLYQKVFEEFYYI